VSRFELPETQFKGQSDAKSSLKSTCSEEITVLSTFLKPSLNFRSNYLKKTTKFGTVREKSGVKI